MLNKKALAGTAGAAKEYVEDVFSTYLYTGTGATQTITNNIDISGKGGLVWIKNRNDSLTHTLHDSERGSTKRLRINTNAETTVSDLVTSFNSNGFTLGSDAGNSGGNFSSLYTYASWTFRKAKKFFDVVTYTGNGSAPRNISHNLSSSPGFIIIKRTDSTGDWWCWHRSTPNANANLYLNYTDAADSGANPMINAVSSTNFTLATNQNATMNINGATYVAYLFAHDAGGFGDDGSDSIIKCDAFTTASSGGSFNNKVTLGWEPQFVLLKGSALSSDWFLYDNRRPSADVDSAYLAANSSAAEVGSNTDFRFEADGFNIHSNKFGNSRAVVYIAIRKGPMKTPTTGTSVYNGIARTGTGATATVTGVGFTPDFVLIKKRSGTETGRLIDRLRGNGRSLFPDTSGIESNEGTVLLDTMDGCTLGSSFRVNENGSTFINWFFRRSPKVFDIVCYTGNGSNRTVSHSLGVVPELIIVKTRGPTVGNGDWPVYDAINGNTKTMYLNASSGSSTNSSMWNNTSPTSSVFTVGTDFSVNYNTDNYVAYLFASLSGVSKVGSYTGNGSSVTVTTDFQPRFILVKRTNSGGNWIVGDSARGLVDGNDPYLLLNSTAVEETGADWVDISSTGFTVNQTNGPNANVNTGTYIYLAIA